MQEEDEYGSLIPQILFDGLDESILEISSIPEDEKAQSNVTFEFSNARPDDDSSVDFDGLSDIDYEDSPAPHLLRVTFLPASGSTRGSFLSPLRAGGIGQRLIPLHSLTRSPRPTKTTPTPTAMASTTRTPQETARLTLNDAAAPTLPAGSSQIVTGVYQHIYETILGFPPNSPVEQHLKREGLNLTDILSLDVSFFAVGLQGNPPGNTPANLGELTRIKQFIAFNRVNVRANGGYLVDMLNVTPIMFEYFRSAIYTTSILATATAPRTATTVPGYSPHTDPVVMFDKQTKRSADSYPKFKEDKEWIKWSRKVNTIAQTQGVSDILDTTFSPDPLDANACTLFTKQNQYMFGVFAETVQTGPGEEIVMRHYASQDGQSVFRDLDTRYRSSPAARLALQQMHTEIVTKIIPPAYTGTYESFIADFLNLMREYNELAPTSTRISDASKCDFLHYALSSVTELAQARALCEHANPSLMHDIDYVASTYRTIASSMDIRRKPSRTTRIVNNVHISNFDDDENYHPFIPVDYEVYAARTRFVPNAADKTLTTRTRRVGLNNATWASLSRVEQTGWDTLSDESKARILKYGSTRYANKDTHSRSANVSVSHVADDTVAPINDDIHNHDTASETLVHKASSTTIPAAHHPGHLNNLLHKLSNPGNSSAASPRQANMMRTYSVSRANSQRPIGSLIDRGANGGLCGSDMRVITCDDTRTINVSGIDNHQLTNLPIVTAGAYMESNCGPVIGIFHQYADIKTGKSIHSSGQLEHYKLDVSDKSIRVGGLQRITTLDNYAFPLDVVDGLVYLQVRPFTDDEWNKLPHVIMTSDVDWEPAILDCTISDDRQWFSSITDIERDIGSPFDEFGRYRQRQGGIINQINAHYFTDVNKAVLNDHFRSLFVHKHALTTNSRDYDKLRPYFLWKPTDLIKHTYENTTQYGRRRTDLGPTIRDTYRSPFPMFNVLRRHEPVATDTITSTVTAVGGFNCAQIFVGRNSHVIDVYGMHSSDEFVNTLEDVIRHRGAMDKLISDRAQVEISKRVLDILRALVISDWQSEPYYQHQNFAERQWQDLKRICHVIMDRSGAPAPLWLLCMEYVAYVMNRMSLPSLRNKAPLMLLTGQVPDISAIPIYTFYQPVYFLHYKSETNPLHKTTESLGYFVGFAETVGHALTFKVYNAVTDKVVYRSRLRVVKDGEKNVRADPDPPIKTVPTSDSNESPSPTLAQQEETETLKPPPEPSFQLNSPYDVKLANGELLPTIDPEQIIGKSFQLPPNPDGTRDTAFVTEMIIQYEGDLHSHPDHVKFRCTVNGEKFEDLLSYAQVLEYLEDETTKTWRFNKISAHSGPLRKGHPEHRGSSYNLLVEWEGNWEPTHEPLRDMLIQDPASVIAYAEANNLLDTKGWGDVKKAARKLALTERQIHQARMQSPRFSPVYMFGVRVPRNHNEAMTLDKENGNTLWGDAEHAELSSIQGFQAFSDRGPRDNAKIPAGYKRITVHMVYAVKHDGRHKARLVAGGHLTDTPVDSVYSSVVSLKGVRMTIFVAELNRLQIWSTDVGNAYLESYTQEKVYIIAGPEFAPFNLQGHVLLIVRALYGLKSSGLRWWERLADVLLALGFTPSRCEADIWMRRIDDHYEYLCIYVDDLIICSKRPQIISDALVDKHHFTLKGTGPIHYHLGCDYFREPDGTLCYGPRRYIDKMITDFETMFNEKPRAYSSPLEKGDHPELDDSELLGMDGIKRYQSLIGSAQWAVQLGRIDITTAVMSLSSYRAAPRKGHLSRMKRVIGYLSKMRNALVRVRVGLPDYSSLGEVRHNWDRSIYGGAKELLPKDIPEPLGEQVICTSYVDANLYHDMLTGRSVTGVLHFFNQTPVDWFSKKQSTVETATYGSEFVAARTATEQIIANRQSLRYLGVKVQGPTILFGDNNSVVGSASVPQSKLGKRHVALSFHRVREAIAANILRFEWIDGEENPADILSKHWGYQQVSNHIQAIMFKPGLVTNIA
jgi:hypothetical protein